MSQKRPKTKDGGEDQDPIDQLLLRRQVHENVGDQSRLERRHDHRHRHVRLLRTEIDIGEENGQRSEEKQGRADQKITADVFADVVDVGRIMLRLVFDRRGSWADYSSIQSR